MARLVERALVMGGTTAGLMAARVLSDCFAQVTILERDQIENGPVIHKPIG
jgi:flavin-dependent dehydrogenase